ncbi:MAG TPA: hypothetical protein VHY09_12065 [Candidatus Methylacidiphilales bacterium]|jgi:hypothetical protein|nr:hypothetical protein [Candidatus Methylacidiphilales bacterium]
MSPTWKAALGVILIFILGWFGGALTTLIIAHRKMMVLATGNTQAITLLLERQTTRGLKLDADQKARLHDLLLENVRQRKELQKQVQPQVWTINHRTLQAINTVLTAGQQQKFQDNLLLFKAHFGRNPLNTGPDEGATSPAQETLGASTNAAAGTPPAQ